jgi:protein-tyrosine phosphatase
VPRLLIDHTGKQDWVRQGKWFLKQTYGTAYYLTNIGLSKRPLNFSSIRSILFICHGNICRSAFSEYYAQKIFREQGIDVDVSSGGLAASQGTSSPREAIESADLFQIDLRSHTSRMVTRTMVDQAMLIVGMHYINYREFQRMFYPFRYRFFLLKHLAWPHYRLLNINDPFGGSSKVFKRCFTEIKICIDTLAGRFRRELKPIDTQGHTI